MYKVSQKTLTELGNELINLPIDTLQYYKEKYLELQKNQPMLYLYMESVFAACDATVPAEIETETDMQLKKYALYGMIDMYTMLEKEYKKIIKSN